MAIGSMMHTFTVQLADVDRGVYEDFSVRAARHPSETDAYMVTRLLAYCLEHEEGIEFGGGVSTTDEPAVLVRDLTGKITAWIEVGAPDAARLHYGNKLADRTAVYTHRDPAKLLSNWEGKTIYNSKSIRLRSFEPSFISEAVTALERRNTLSLSVTEGQMYFELNDTSLSSPLHEHQLP
ncbi:YaeQ family protein [Leucobacter coleopterorum]|uniref:YaeQ family protein n=1 Tax=Leucobacter coleopterorum TaxID=2714933 RepID=A0ABX6JWL6_9MICO|nr:YaeQ family protein [Leucobacter coleopterorum]QIM18633.1 YaeQ family protein [Leucobacter coleopterorum]